MMDFFKALTGLKIDLPYTGKVKGLHAQLIWQFLRFNEKYRDGYDKLKSEAASDDSGELPMYFAQRWCISTPVDYELETLPVDQDDDGSDLTPFFDYKPTMALPKWKYLKDWGDILLPDDARLFVMNPHAPIDQVMRVITSMDIVPARESIQSKLPDQLVEYLVCHYFMKVKGMGPADLSPIFYDIFNLDRTDVLQTTTLTGKLEGFSKVAELAPWCFFTPPHRTR